MTSFASALLFDFGVVNSVVDSAIANFVTFLTFCLVLGFGRPAVSASSFNFFGRQSYSRSAETNPSASIAKTKPENRRSCAKTSVRL